MIELKSTSVYCGGRTSSALMRETSVCSSNVNVRDKALDIKFQMDSAGRGVTEVLLQIGLDDVPQLLKDVAAYSLLHKERCYARLTNGLLR